MFFSDTDRAIYECPVTQQKLDPLAVKRHLIISTNNRFNALVREMSAEDERVRVAAEGELARAGRAAFNLTPLDPRTGKGTLDAVVLEAVTAFTKWLTKKGSKAQSGPASAPCTDCP